MTLIDEHMYVVGQCHVQYLTTEQCAALGSEEPVPCFYELYKDGVLYHSTSGAQVQGKRDSTMCVFERSDSTQYYWTNSALHTLTTSYS